MKILAIRGRNLASLAGDFEVRLDTPPLATAGLFAIAGKTGAGKSTILDALCLALYDRIPRLLNGSGVEVGRADEEPAARLRANDVRSILRRGTGEGFAEVEFRAIDGRRYRARWSVRRARGRPDGRFQAQDLALWDLDADQNLSGNKTEVLPRIEALLGLTFDQFRRSVLLAQGDFAAFLRANARERAELLERITGTEIYGRLSQAAHERAREEGDQLGLAEQRLGEHRPLDEDARQALETQLAEAQGRLDQCRARQARLQQAQGWYQARERLAAEHAQAQGELAQAERAWDGAAQRRRDWERIRTLQALRLPLTRLDQTARSEAETRQDLEASQAEAQRLQTTVGQAETALQAAAERHAVAERARRDAAPQLAEARRLDTLVQGAERLLAKACDAHAEAGKATQGAEAALAGLERRREILERDLVAADAWLEEQAALRPLAAQWDAWERELGRYAEARKQRDQARGNQARAEADVARLAAGREREAARAHELETRRETLQTQAGDLERQAAAFDPEHLAAERETLTRRRQDLEGWRLHARQAGESRTRLGRQQMALAQVQDRQRELEVRLQAVGSELDSRRAALAEAEVANGRMLLASAESVDALRRQLADGQPCPVCGAQEHPWAHRDAEALQGVARDQQRRVEELRTRVEALNREQSAGLAENQELQRRGAELTGEVDAEQRALAALLAAWAEFPSDALRPPEPFEPDLATRIDAELDAGTVRLERIGEEESQGRGLAKGIERARAESERLRAESERAARGLQDLDMEIAQNRHIQGGAAADEERAGQAMTQVAALLADPFAGLEGWEARLAADPGAFTQQYREVVAEWRRRQEQREQARQARDALVPELVRAGAQRESAAADLARRDATRKEQEQASADLRGQRACCLDGRPVEAVEQALDAAVVQAQAGLEAARNAREQSRRELTALDGRMAVQAQALARQEAAASEARTELEASLREHAVGLDELRRALVHDQAWVDAERAALDQLEADRRSARGLVEERERRLAEHVGTPSPEWPAEALAEALEVAAADLEAFQGQWGTLHGQREQDDARRQASVSLQAELERQRARWSTWESLRGLIGSADGAKFRNFAQGLTLDLLVAHANVHLEDLARRYELQRVPGGEMELQVIDREMGDEVRGIHSLSGGEGFLVSLALALGLASLASDRVQVDSLFIDEGFGALDADSLDMAIASLDALYGLGRQVGVISHVGTLVERIGVRVQIDKQGGGRSRLSVLTA